MTKMKKCLQSIIICEKAWKYVEFNKEVQRANFKQTLSKKLNIRLLKNLIITIILLIYVKRSK